MIKKLLPFIILLLSIALLCMALPRVRASLNNVPVDFAIDKLNNNKAISNIQLTQLISTTQTSIALHDSPHYWEDLSALFFYQAQQKNLSTPILKQAQHSMEQALLRAPANAYLWYRLAVIDILLQQPTEKTAKKLMMSIMVGPNESKYLIPRLSFCLMLFPSLTENELDSIISQILIAWSLSPVDFLRTCASNQAYMNIITNLLKDQHPTVLNEIVAALEKPH